MTDSRVEAINASIERRLFLYKASHPTFPVSVDESLHRQHQPADGTWGADCMAEHGTPTPGHAT